MIDPISVEVFVNVPIVKAWKDFTDPEAIMVWNAASEDWHTTKSENDLRVGGTFSSRMEAKDGSTGFDFTGTYTTVTPYEKIVYVLEDGRTVVVTFASGPDGTRITETFDPENENSREMQQNGWQAILDNFKKYTESH